jgi:hypothetical protein
VTPSLDPVLVATLRGSLALLFVAAALHKLRDRSAFRAALAGYGLLPEAWVAPAAALLAAAELAVAAGLLVPALGRLASLAAAGLLALYAGAMLAALAAGRRGIDCGCAGPAGARPLGPMHVARNALLVAASLAASLPAAARPVAWLDAVTVAGAMASLACLASAAELSLEQAARGRALRRRREA